MSKVQAEYLYGSPDAKWCKGQLAPAPGLLRSDSNAAGTRGLSTVTRHRQGTDKAQTRHRRAVTWSRRTASVVQ